MQKPRCHNCFREKSNTTSERVLCSMSFSAGVSCISIGAHRVSQTVTSLRYLDFLPYVNPAWLSRFSSHKLSGQSDPLTKSRVNHSIVPCFLQSSQHGIQDRQEPPLNPASTPHIAYSSSIHYWRTAFGLYCESYKIMEAPMWVHNRAGCAFEISDANEFPLCMQLLSSWVRPSWPSSL